MQDNIESLKQRLRQQEKLASLGMLSAGIAHEIQNPLNFVINFSRMSKKLLDELDEVIDSLPTDIPSDTKEDMADIMEDLKTNLNHITEHGERATSIIQGILLVSRGKDDEYIPTDVAHLVKEYLWLSYHAMRAHYKGFNLSIGEDYQPSLPMVSAIPQDLSRAIINLMNNACYTVWKKQQADTDGTYKPRIDVKVFLADSAAADAASQHITISIADNGEGMTTEVQQRIYDNFFTTKPVGEGTGLGMAITRDIVEKKHGGTLAFTTTLGEGTCFSITIPVKRPADNITGKQEVKD